MKRMTVYLLTAFLTAGMFILQAEETSLAAEYYPEISICHSLKKQAKAEELLESFAQVEGLQVSLKPLVHPDCLLHRKKTQEDTKLQNPVLQRMNDAVKSPAVQHVNEALDRPVPYSNRTWKSLLLTQPIEATAFLLGYWSYLGRGGKKPIHLLSSLMIYELAASSFVLYNHHVINFFEKRFQKSENSSIAFSVLNNAYWLGASSTWELPLHSWTPMTMPALYARAGFNTIAGLVVETISALYDIPETEADANYLMPLLSNTVAITGSFFGGTLLNRLTMIPWLEPLENLPQNERLARNRVLRSLGIFAESPYRKRYFKLIATEAAIIAALLTVYLKFIKPAKINLEEATPEELRQYLSRTSKKRHRRVLAEGLFLMVDAKTPYP